MNKLKQWQIKHSINQEAMNDLSDLLGFNLSLHESDKHPKCKGWYDEHTGDYDCGYDKENKNLLIMCEDCVYGTGNKHPRTGELIENE